METPFYTILLKTFYAQKAGMRPYIAKLGLTSGQPKILNYLKHHNYCMQKELAISCDIEPATVSKILNAMEEKQLIKRNLSKENKRIILVSITKKGIALQEETELYFSRVKEESLKGFTEKEKEQFTEYLCRMYYNLTGKAIE